MSARLRQRQPHRRIHARADRRAVSGDLHEVLAARVAVENRFDGLAVLALELARVGDLAELGEELRRPAAGEAQGLLVGSTQRDKALRRACLGKDIRRRDAGGQRRGLLDRDPALTARDRSILPSKDLQVLCLLYTSPSPRDS